MAGLVGVKDLARAKGRAFRAVGGRRTLILTSGASFTLAAGLTLAAGEVKAAAGFASMTSREATGSFIFALVLTSTGGGGGAAGLGLTGGSGFTGGVISGAGLAATAVLVLARGLTSADFARPVFAISIFFTGLTVTVGVLASTFATGWRTLFGDVFFGAGVGLVSGDLALAVFARGTGRAEIGRRESGFAAVIFFGFFIATVLATRWRVCWWRVSPVFRACNGNLVLTEFTPERRQLASKVLAKINAPVLDLAGWNGVYGSFQIKKRERPVVPAYLHRG
jgi:hypothetical protein